MCSNMLGTCTGRARGVPVNRTPYKPTTRISRLGSARLGGEPCRPGTGGKDQGEVARAYAGPRFAFAQCPRVRRVTLRSSLALAPTLATSPGGGT